MEQITISTWEFILGLITLISFGVNIHQYYKRKLNQDHVVGVYSQLWDIIVELDKGTIKEVSELERLINQVIIALNSQHRSLKSEEQIIRPWHYIFKRRYKEHIDWEKERVSLARRLENLKREQNAVEDQIKEIGKNLQFKDDKKKDKNGQVQNVPGEKKE